MVRGKLCLINPWRNSPKSKQESTDENYLSRKDAPHKRKKRSQTYTFGITNVRDKWFLELSWREGGGGGSWGTKGDELLLGASPNDLQTPPSNNF